MYNARANLRHPAKRDGCSATATVVSRLPTKSEVRIVFILKLAERIVESIRKLRVNFSGREFAEAAVEFGRAA